MVRKRRPRKTSPKKVSPKTPSRVTKRRGPKQTRAHARHHPALAGLGLAAVGVLIPLGALMVTKSALIDMRPFRLGLGVALAGLMLTLGTAHGGLVGDGLESLVALGLGTTGATILGVLLTIAGTLFLTGAS